MIRTALILPGGQLLSNILILKKNKENKENKKHPQNHALKTGFCGCFFMTRLVRCIFRLAADSARSGGEGGGDASTLLKMFV